MRLTLQNLYEDYRKNEGSVPSIQLMPYKQYFHSPAALNQHFQEIKVNITSNKTHQHHEPLDMLHSCQTCETSIPLLETSDKPQMRNILQNSQSVLLRSFNVMKHREKLKNYYRLEETKGKLELHTKWNLG